MSTTSIEVNIPLNVVSLLNELRLGENDDVLTGVDIHIDFDKRFKYIRLDWTNSIWLIEWKIDRQSMVKGSQCRIRILAGIFYDRSSIQ